MLFHGAVVCHVDQKKKKERKTHLNKANKGKQPYRVSEITVNEDHLWKVAAG